MQELSNSRLKNAENLASRYATAIPSWLLNPCLPRLGRNYPFSPFCPLRLSCPRVSISRRVLLYSFARWTPLTDTLLRSFCVPKRKDRRHAASYTRIPGGWLPLPATNRPLGMYTLFTPLYEPLPARFSLNHPLMHTPAPCLLQSLMLAAFARRTGRTSSSPPRNMWHLSTLRASYLTRRVANIIPVDGAAVLADGRSLKRGRRSSFPLLVFVSSDGIEWALSGLEESRGIRMATS